MKKLILLTLSLCSLVTLGAIKGSLTNNDQVVTPAELTQAIKDKRDMTNLVYNYTYTRRGPAYTLALYDIKTLQQLTIVSMPRVSHTKEGLFEEYTYQTKIGSKTYYLVSVFGYSQEWTIVIADGNTIEANYTWRRDLDGKSAPDHEVRDDKYCYVLFWNTDAEYYVTEEDSLALKSDLELSAIGVKSTLRDEIKVVSTNATAASQKATEALSLAGDVATLVYGDDCQLVSTNYNSATKLPSLFLRFKIKNETTGEMEWYKVWDELTRWNWLFDTYIPSNLYTKAEMDIKLDEKADRAWGHYDSHTGTYAPDGFTWVSSPKIAIAGGMAYQRIVNSGNGIFVLCSNGLVTEFGNDASSTNGFFRIEDDKGNAIFEITKGTATLASATAADITVQNVNGVQHMFIPYNVESSEHPKLTCCTDLNKKDWKAEDEDGFQFNVNWTGSSGAWVAEVWAKQPTTSAFVKAEYKKGAEDIIRHNAPASFSKIEIGGRIYKAKVTTINGQMVLGLE